MIRSEDKPHGSGARWLSRELALLVVIRVLYCLLLSHRSLSVDLGQGWPAVASDLAAGGNPYRDTSFLNWPPLWMQILFVLGRLQSLTGIGLLRLIQGTLIAIEAMVACETYRLAARWGGQAAARKALRFGIVLNPVALLLICQHGNFDVIAGGFILLCIGFILRHEAGGDAVDWLIACFFLGLAILTKTAPFVLLPLIALHVRQQDWRTRSLAFAMILVPVTLGMSIIYTLSPTDVIAKVLSYRSLSGFYGITGLLQMVHGEVAIAAYASVFAPLLSLGLLMLCWWLARRTLSAHAIVVTAAMLLLLVPTLGPGYAPQYAYWYLPLLVVSFAMGDERWRRLLLLVFAVASLTYIVEYGFLPAQGAAIVHALGDRWPFGSWSRHWSPPQAQSLIRLPLFLAQLALLACGARKVHAELRPQNKST